MQTSSHADPAPAADDTHLPLDKREYEQLADFRFALRSYLRFSEQTVRRHGLSPQQYQLMLAIKGFPGRDWASVTELAGRLQLKHHSVVELAYRAQRQGLVTREPHPDDARAVRVVLTAEGERALDLLSALHRDELRRVGGALVPPDWPGRRRPRGRRPPVTGPEQSPGGDPVCWLERVCDACGGVDDGPAPAVCTRCGAPRANPPASEATDRP